MTALSDLGPFKDAVGFGASAVTASAAFLTPWWGRRKWHPTSVDVEKLGGLVAAVVIGLLYLLSANSWFQPLLGALAVLSLALAVWSGLQYSRLLTQWRYEVLESAKVNRHRTRYIIGGSAFTPNALAMRAGPQPTPVQDILAGCAYDPDCVWTRDSIAENENRVARFFLGVTCGGTIALAAVGILGARLGIAG